MDFMLHHYFEIQTVLSDGGAAVSAHDEMYRRSPCGTRQFNFEVCCDSGAVVTTGKVTLDVEKNSLDRW
jgi:hypothetical protein